MKPLARASSTLKASAHWGLGTRPRLHSAGFPASLRFTFGNLHSRPCQGGTSLEQLLLSSFLFKEFFFLSIFGPPRQGRCVLAEALTSEFFCGQDAALTSIVNCEFNYQEAWRLAGSLIHRVPATAVKLWKSRVLSLIHAGC